MHSQSTRLIRERGEFGSQVHVEFVGGFDSNRTLKLVFIALSLRVKVLGFRKEREFKEEEDDRANKVVLVIAVEQNI